MRFRLLLAGAGLAILLQFGSGCAGDERQVGPGPDLGRLNTSEGRIVGPRDGPVLLRGVNAFAVVGEGEPLAREQFDRMRDAGFNVVRLVAYWDELEPAPPEGGRRRYDARRLAALDQAVDHARAAGLYVVLSPVHLYKLSPAFGGKGVPSWLYANGGPTLEEAQASMLEDDVLQGHLRTFLRMIGKRYADNSAVAAIDPVNEPPASDNRPLIDWYATTLRLLRRSAPEMLVLVEPRFGDSFLSAEDLRRLPDRRRAVLSPHFYYAGGGGNGYGPDGSQAGEYLWDEQGDYSADRDALAEHLDVLRSAASGADMPLWVGEFGVERDAGDGVRWVRDTTSLFDDEDFGWAYWVHESQDSFSLSENGAYGELGKEVAAAATR